MNSETEQARRIAERVAQRVGSAGANQPVTDNVATELASMRALLSDLQKKLTDIESRVGGSSDHVAPSIAQRPVPLTHSPWLAGVNATAAHPSQERFGVEEAVVSELVDFFEKEKACSLETSKPCDHCAMCSSRGF
jgi:hypothetical protein